jgi:hypothetical protein
MLSMDGPEPTVKSSNSQNEMELGMVVVGHRVRETCVSDVVLLVD